MKRIITYDLKNKETDNYQDLYDVFEELNGKQLTESSYYIDTDLGMNEIISKIRNVIHKDDIVYYISIDKKHELFWNKIL